jgi:hypothetical protein
MEPNLPPSRRVPEGYRRIQTTINEESAKILDDYSHLHFDDDRARALEHIIPVVCASSELQRLGANAKLYFHKKKHRQDLMDRAMDAEDAAKSKACRQGARAKRKKARDLKAAGKPVPPPPPQDNA